MYVHVCARVHFCVCVCVGVSPVNVGFAEDGFQAVVKLEEGHVLGETARHQGRPAALTSQTIPHRPPVGAGWRVNIQNQRSLAL